MNFNAGYNFDMSAFPPEDAAVYHKVLTWIHHQKIYMDTHPNECYTPSAGRSPQQPSKNRASPRFSPYFFPRPHGSPTIIQMNQAPVLQVADPAQILPMPPIPPVLPPISEFLNFAPPPPHPLPSQMQMAVGTLVETSPRPQSPEWESPESPNSRSWMYDPIALWDIEQARRRREERKAAGLPEESEDSNQSDSESGSKKEEEDSIDEDYHVNENCEATIVAPASSESTEEESSPTTSEPVISSAASTIQAVEKPVQNANVYISLENPNVNLNVEVFGHEDNNFEVAQQEAEEVIELPSIDPGYNYAPNTPDFPEWLPINDEEFELLAYLPTRK